MSNRPGPRVPVSIALNERERVLAQAIGRFFDSDSAGVGVRQALRVMEERLKSTGHRDELDRIIKDIRAERAAERGQ